MSLRPKVNRRIPRPRRPVDEVVDRNLTDAKNDLANHVNYMFGTFGTGPDRDLMMQYSDRVQYLIGNDQLMNVDED